MPKDKYEIAVSGAAQIGHCCKEIKKLSREIGREIAKQDCNLVTGATTGAPYYATLGCKEEGGFSIGFSPAVSESSHLKTYKLPLENFDVMVYTGADYTGRNIIMTKSADGVVIVCGRMGTLHEFVTAFEIQKPIAVLEGSGGTADIIRGLVKFPHRGKLKVVFDKDPKKLIKKLIKLIEDSKRSKK